MRIRAKKDNAICECGKNMRIHKGGIYCKKCLSKLGKKFRKEDSDLILEQLRDFLKEKRWEIYESSIFITKKGIKLNIQKRTER